MQHWYTNDTDEKDSDPDVLIKSSESETKDFDIRNERKPFINVLFFGTLMIPIKRIVNSGPDHLSDLVPHMAKNKLLI